MNAPIVKRTATASGPSISLPFQIGIAYWAGFLALICSISIVIGTLSKWGSIAYLVAALSGLMLWRCLAIWVHVNRKRSRLFWNADRMRSIIAYEGDTGPFFKNRSSVN